MLLHLYNIALFSFCLIFCASGFLSPGFMVIAVPASVLYPCWVRLAQQLVQSLWLEGLLPVFWWVDLSIFLLIVRAMSGDGLWSVWGLTTTLGSLLAVTCDCVPILLVVWCGVLCWGLQAVGWSWVLDSVGDLYWRSHLLIFSQTRNSLVVQYLELSASTTEAQA